MCYKINFKQLNHLRCSTNINIKNLIKAYLLSVKKKKELLLLKLLLRIIVEKKDDKQSHCIKYTYRVRLKKSIEQNKDLLPTIKNNGNFVNNIFHLPQTGRLQLHRSRKFKGERRNSSVDNRLHRRCNDCFRASKFLWDLAQAQASKCCNAYG